MGVQRRDSLSSPLRVHGNGCASLLCGAQDYYRRSQVLGPQHALIRRLLCAESTCWALRRGARLFIRTHSSIQQTCSGHPPWVRHWVYILGLVWGWVPPVADAETKIRGRGLSREGSSPRKSSRIWVLDVRARGSRGSPETVQGGLFGSDSAPGLPALEILWRTKQGPSLPTWGGDGQ